MKFVRSTLAALVVAASGAALLEMLGGSDTALAQKPAVQKPAVQKPSLPNIAQCDGVIAFSEKVENKYQQVTVIDPKQRVLCVYHISLVDGQIALKSVRNFHWDTQILEWNSANPLPKEIQALLEQR